MDNDNLPLPATEINEKLISSFMKSTSSSREEAKSFLETHQWDLNAAVSAFMDVNAAVSAFMNLNTTAESNVTNPGDTQLLSTVTTRTRNPFNKHALAEISGGSNDSDSDDYDGGEQSGRTIMQEPEEAENVDESDEERPSSRFVPAEPVVIDEFIVTIWRNGFTVNNGPLKTMDNPEEAAFLEYVQMLESPRDLNPEDNQIRHRIILIRRQEEDFNESPKFTPFQGVGRTLGGSDSAATEPPASSESLTTTPLPSTSRVVDPAAPTISVHDTATRMDLLRMCLLYTGVMEEPEEGEDVDDNDEESDVENPVQSSSAAPEVVINTFITIWRNGFSYDDGPLINTMDNPEDAAYIEHIQGLESPRYRNPEDNQVRHRIKLIRRQEEDFNESPNFTPFQGVGRTLGRSDSLNTTTPPPVNLVVDPAAPVTSIQFRLADGSRISSQFNTHHTVRDVRGFIDASRPGGSNDYQLLIMGSPPKPLLDFDQTIEKAGISNSVLIQKS